ncbi:hypothetical protein CEXT_486421 [Caerostris extrusa]|uniref:Uncharacterized protein n=1 Tax=Caerostris extrusa TaxID=172846 RepID=A0AAV4SR09_CAEEX|nr:hypothetical protein CEXT_486421 [Caerostris extrusa]
MISESDTPGHRKVSLKTLITITSMRPRPVAKATHSGPMRRRMFIEYDKCSLAAGELWEEQSVLASLRFFWVEEFWSDDAWVGEDVPFRIAKNWCTSRKIMEM